ncbi:unnamed protein product [Adineta steineri]|uniref:Uncharacterized protein n=2 Tax=Adineta steineri TaxID=433720 RepID=A0A814HZY3_9BILA|nr:unnamed protein product [Adineta steineri]CAF1424031.1 unnamed protein product [Adineta steineri]CAF1457893.1 unnamed protein product [Adineta steineri]
MSTEKKSSSWEDLIKKNCSLKSCTCKIYNRQVSPSSNDNDKSCCCGRLIRCHSFNGISLLPKIKNNGETEWNPPDHFGIRVHSTKVPINVFGRIKSTDCKFVRVDIRSKLNDIYNLLVDDCGGVEHKPSLILSVYGGAKYFLVPEKLEKEIIRGIVDAASGTDTWILTAGINNGVSKLVGEGISHYRLLREYPNKVKCIGMTMWGTVNESTRFELKHTTDTYRREFLHRQISDNTQEDKETIEKNHTHCILFDDGQLSGYLGDTQRHQLVTHACQQANHTCYAVTIIVEGGINTLEVIKNDIKAQRPVVLIKGSGRLADTLATLIEQSSTIEKIDQNYPTDEDIKKVVEYFIPTPDNFDFRSTIDQIKNILIKTNRYFLNVFSLNNDNNMAQTIFNAIFVKNKKNVIGNNDNNRKNEGNNQEQQGQNDENKLIDLALEWNYFEGVLPILQTRQDAKLRLTDPDSIKKYIDDEKKLFKKSLEKNRPKFVEYLLAANSDPLILIETGDTSTRHKTISNLYEGCHAQMNKNRSKDITTLFGEISSKTTEELDSKLKRFVGSFIGPIYSCERDSIKICIRIDLKAFICTCCELKQVDDNQTTHDLNPKHPYTKDHLLRDLFLMSIFLDMPEMAKIILIHIPFRICAALVASAIFKRYAKSSTTIYLKNKFQNQALEFETYAGMFIDKCYEFNERIACELLLRQIPLFGNITPMQVAISSESGKLLETACFDQTLAQVWYNKLSIKNQQMSAKLLQIPTILTLGLSAPLAITYRDVEIEVADRTLSSDGINYYMNKKISTTHPCTKYWLLFKYFHQSPMVKMCYHFISYIFFLLVFSYMMLYHLDSGDPDIKPHWTEIYVIITISTMFCEEVRKIYHEYKTRMTERWGSTGSFLLTVLTNAFYIIPYFLFYLGLGFRYRAYNENIISTARIIWAFDLELWYLRSLRFIVVLKFIGPKLFMLKNMLRDLFAFVYIIFIAIAAYGVVSRSLIFYKQIPFTINDLFKGILYEPYWFIYGDVSDKDLLDEIISNETQSYVAEATATHVLLAFHMLFINILILNLLIAVFTRTIDDIQENTEFYWHYQRYTFVREYFERPPLAYPPLIIFTHIFFLFLALKRKLCLKFCKSQVTHENDKSQPKTITRIFKMIPVGSQVNERWDIFENAATQSYARTIFEKNKKKNDLSIDENISKNKLLTIDNNETQLDNNEQQIIENLKEEIMTLKSVVTNNQKHLEENNVRMEKHAHEVNKSLDWIMRAIARVKMNDPEKPPLDLESTVL